MIMPNLIFPTTISVVTNESCQNEWDILYDYLQFLTISFLWIGELCVWHCYHNLMHVYKSKTKFECFIHNIEVQRAFWFNSWTQFIVYVWTMLWTNKVSQSYRTIVWKHLALLISFFMQKVFIFLKRMFCTVSW